MFKYPKKKTNSHKHLSDDIEFLSSINEFDTNRDVENKLLAKEQAIEILNSLKKSMKIMGKLFI